MKVFCLDRLLFIISFLFVLLFGLSACVDDSKKSDLVVGVSAEYPPFEYIDGGQVKGFDIDLMNLVAERLGKKVVYKDIQFSSLFPALNSGQINIAISAIGITQERKDNFLMSMPYITDGVAIVFKKSRPIVDMEDLHDEKMATQIGSTMELWFKRNFPDRPLILFNANNQGVESLKINAVDGVIINSFQAKAFVMENSSLDYFVIKNIDVDLGYAIVLKKNEQKLMNEINNVLSKLLKSGEIEKLKEKWSLG